MQTLIFYIYYVVLWAVSKLPFFVLFRISDVLFILMYYLVQYRKKVVIHNLRHSFPEKTENQILKITKAYYKHLADVLVESAAVMGMSKKDLEKRYKYRNPEVLQQFEKQNKSVILVAGHYGNWEWATSLPFATSSKVVGLYSPLKNKRIDLLEHKNRSKFGIHVIPAKSGAREIIGMHQQGIPTVSYFLSDQSPQKGKIQYWLDFLNQKTPMILGTERIAQKIDAAVIFMSAHKIKRGYYEVEFKLITEHPKEEESYFITRTHVQMLEEIIQQKPEYWLWSHRRWKHKPE